jgi:hypothetical protein
VVKGDNPMNLRAREVQLLGDHGNGAWRNVTECGLDGVQYFEEGTRSLTVLRDDAPHGCVLLGR